MLTLDQPGSPIPVTAKAKVKARAGRSRLQNTKRPNRALMSISDEFGKSSAQGFHRKKLSCEIPQQWPACAESKGAISSSVVRLLRNQGCRVWASKLTG